MEGPDVNPGMGDVWGEYLSDARGEIAENIRAVRGRNRVCRLIFILRRSDREQHRKRAAGSSTQAGSPHPAGSVHLFLGT